jgi:hypothetical protein
LYLRSVESTFNPEDIRREDGHWINSDVFRQEGLNFMSNGYYTTDLPGTIAYNDYWDEQLRRCKEGYEVAGHKVTGHHYEYLNFTQIQIVHGEDPDSPTAIKETKMPDFWDGDYDYYWSKEIARNGVANSGSLLTTQIQRDHLKTLSAESQQLEWERLVANLKMKVKPHPSCLGGGFHMLVGKCRRKGYSYKNASVCANTYNTTRKALTVIGAFDKKYLYPKGTMGMASEYLSFFNKHTAWGKAREFVDKQEHKRASFEEINANGMKVESGYMSEIMAVTFKDNPDAARGKDALEILFEEAGVFPNLTASVDATYPGLTAGRYITGQITVFGTGGDMESGTVDFAQMFYNPLERKFMGFINIWDKNAENSICGFFHPVYMNMEGYYDRQGNSDIEGALAAEMAERARIIKNSTSSLALQKRVQEYPICPSEAFLTVSTNDFPVVELRARYNKVMANNLHLRSGQPCFLMRVGGNNNPEVGPVTKPRIKAIPDLENLIDPVWNYRPKNPDLKSGVIIYEHPPEHPVRGLYKIGYDPYRMFQSNEVHPSLAAIYVYKATQKFSYTRNTIVAQYVGRPQSPDEVNRICEMLAELYNAEIMHENEVTHVRGYFEKRHKLNLLASQPDSVISKNIKKSTVARVYGIHMADKLKDAGEKYIKEWLITVRDYDENGDPILNLDTLNDPGLIDELILYNRKGNFDRVMAFMMVMFQLEEDGEEKQYGETQKNENVEQLLSQAKRQFKKSSFSLN